VKALTSSVAVVLTIALCSLAYGIHETQVDGTKIPEPGADPAKLYRYINLPKPYAQRWTVWREKGKMYAGKEPHGSFLTTYLNKEALDSLKAGKVMADGSVIVQENYGTDRKLESLMVAYKIKGYSAETGDWFCAKYGPMDGYVFESGEASSCSKCHRENRIDDYFVNRK